jgi:hypothetical protein
MMRPIALALALAASAATLTLAPASARADDNPYSLPWQLRPVMATTAVRSDTSFAKYEDKASNGGFTIASFLTASYRIPGTSAGEGGKGTGLAPLLRLAIVQDSPPSGNGGFAVVNPVLGATYGLRFGDFRAAGFLAFGIPIGMGGGDTPDVGPADARAKGPLARASMDNSFFAVNDFSVVPGVDFAYVAGGLTVQVEATLFQLERVRGSQKQLEASKTNFTTGLHVGYFLAPVISLGGDLRYQRWLNGPFSADINPVTQENLNFGVGPRLHFKLGGDVSIHPGIAYTRGISKEMAAATPNYHIVQLDIPIAL